MTKTPTAVNSAKFMVLFIQPPFFIFFWISARIIWPLSYIMIIFFVPLCLYLQVHGYYEVMFAFWNHRSCFSLTPNLEFHTRLPEYSSTVSMLGSSENKFHLCFSPALVNSTLPWASSHWWASLRLVLASSTLRQCGLSCLAQSTLLAPPHSS